MIDARRAKKPRLRPEVFGLSTLDTVTCALGGSIMLLVLLSAGAVPEAKITLVETRSLFQSGEGQDGLKVNPQAGADKSIEVRNLAMIYVDTKNETRVSIRPTKCAEIENSILSMGSSSTQYSEDGRSRQHGFAIWPEQNKQLNCKKIALELSYEPAVEGCRIILVSGNHFQQRPRGRDIYGRCPKAIKLRSNGHGVFQFDKGS